MKNKLCHFYIDNNAMEFIDVGIIVVGALLLLTAIYYLINIVYNNINETPMDIPGKKAK